MSKTRRLAIATLSLFALACIGFLAISYFDRSYGQPTREFARMMSVRHIAADAISTHYAKHGRYPDSLSELPLETLSWGDEGSSILDLNAWRYESNGHELKMTWTNSQGLELFLAGKNGTFSYRRETAK